MNEPAFPLAVTNGGETDWHSGMTLRDYFAAKAMQGILKKQKHNPSKRCHAVGSGGKMVELEETIGDFISRESYAMADAMLKERANDKR